MQTKHTPGPWRWVRFPHENRAVLIGPAGYSVIMDCDPTQEDDANCALIGQAPELLRCLTRAIDVIKNNAPESQWSDCGVFEMEATVAKALSEDVWKTAHLRGKHTDRDSIARATGKTL